MIERGCVDENEQGLTKCQWANLCFSYYHKLIPNWENLRYSCSEHPRSTADVVVRLPYIIRTFDPRKRNVVEVLQAVNGDFVVTATFPLPDDGFEECYEPQMTVENVFAVTRRNTTIIFKSIDGVFGFARALHFTAKGSFISCSDVNGLSKFMSKEEGLQLANLTCGLVTENVIWFLESNYMNVYVWNYMESELLLKCCVPCFTENPVHLRSSDNHVFLTHRNLLSIFSVPGKSLWHCEGSSVSSLSWNKTDCGFIQGMTDGSSRVVCLEFPKLTPTNIDVEHPVAITLHKTDRLAYCMCAWEITMNIFCVSLSSGMILWDTVVLSSTQSLCSSIKPTFSGFIEMNIVLGRYITVYGVDGESSDLCSSFINPGMLSLYSSSGGKFVCSESFEPYTVLYLGDHLILAGKSTSNSYQDWRKYKKYEMYNFSSSQNC